MMRTVMMWAVVLTAALSAAWAADKGKVESGNLSGVWVCKSLAPDGNTVWMSELRFSGTTMVWFHPRLPSTNDKLDMPRLDAGFGVTQDGRLFGVVTTAQAYFYPAAGEPFSLKMSLDGDELTLTDFKAAEPKDWPPIKGVYRKKP